MNQTDSLFSELPETPPTNLVRLRAALAQEEFELKQAELEGASREDIADIQCAIRRLESLVRDEEQREMARNAMRQNAEVSRSRPTSGVADTKNL